MKDDQRLRRNKAFQMKALKSSTRKELKMIHWLLSAYVIRRKKRIGENQCGKESKILSVKDRLCHARIFNFSPVGNKEPTSVSNPRMMVACTVVRFIFHKPYHL